MNQKKRIYIFGTGDYGKRLYNFLESLSISISGWLRSSAMANEQLEGMPVYGLSEAKKMVNDGVVFIALFDEKEARYIAAKLMNEGIPLDRIFDYSSFIKRNLLLKKRCPICGDTLKDYISGDDVKSNLFENHHVIGAGHRAKKVCPACSCIDRVRWLYYVLATKTSIFECGQICVLHFAPEKEIREILEMKDITY